MVYRNVTVVRVTDLGNATWSVWGDWPNCTSPCGVGNVTRYRTCNGGQNCNGSSEETIPCDSNITCQGILKSGCGNLNKTHQARFSSGAYTQSAILHVQHVLHN